MNKILIIGATSAQAQATARLFAADGASLFLAGRNPQKLGDVAEDLKARGAASVDSMIVDLNDFSRHQELIQKADDSLEGLEAVLIAHGTLGDQAAGQADFAVAEQELKTNLLSTISLLTILANLFEGRGKGCLAVISSVAGDRGRQSNYIYGTAKGGLSVFLSGLRNRLQRSGVSVLTIKPGFVDSPMTAAFSKGVLWAKPEDIAKIIHSAMLKGKDVVYAPGFWRLIMFIIKALPEWLFKRLSL
jgi:decaprenylphospho-beta-D-erythro-pentofuranosid-2-ulose 2-reductase